MVAQGKEVFTGERRSLNMPDLSGKFNDKGEPLQRHLISCHLCTQGPASWNGAFTQPIGCKECDRVPPPCPPPCSAPTRSTTHTTRTTHTTHSTHTHARTLTLPQLNCARCIGNIMGKPYRDHREEVRGKPGSSPGPDPDH